MKMRERWEYSEGSLFLQMLFLERFFGFEVQGQGVDAIALAGGFWAVGENVAKVCLAVAANHFGADHAVGFIDNGFYFALGEDIVKAGPAGSRVEFGFGGEEVLAAGYTAVYAFLIMFVEFSTKRSLGALKVAHVFLLLAKMGEVFRIHEV
jgi:hypothetical protein